MLLPETLKLHNQSEFEFRYIYFLPWKNQMVASLEREGGKVECISAQNNLQILLSVYRVNRYLRLHTIDIIHAHLPWAGLVARICGKMMGIPVIYTEHNKQERYHFVTRLLNVASFNFLSRIIAVSEDVAKSVYKHARGLTSELTVLTNGVNTETFMRSHFSPLRLRHQLKIPFHSPVIGIVSVFRDQKRLDLWLRIASKISQMNPQVHFVIVGDGPQKNQLQELRDKLGLGKQVHMPGLQTEVGPYLAVFDIFMMTSIFEGLPVALLEAMSMECPVISTSAGGIPEVVRHEVEGLLCDVHDVDELQKFALMLIENVERRNVMGRAARDRIVSKFGMQSMVESLEKVYRSHASPGPSAPIIKDK